MTYEEMLTALAAIRHQATAWEDARKILRDMQTMLNGSHRTTVDLLVVRAWIGRVEAALDGEKPPFGEPR